MANYKLTKKEIETITRLLQEGKDLPSVYKNKLFATDDVDYVEATKDYKLVYKGKTRKEDVIADTPSAPLQKMRDFKTDNLHKNKDWSNMLIFGDNLYALKALYEDQRGENKFGTKNKIKLIYIDPPFATRQDFMKDREKAYRDKIIGAQFIEFLRKRLILLREILADDGSIFVHLDGKKGHYIKAIMDEVFGEHNFLNEIIWHYQAGTGPKKSFAKKHDNIFFYAKEKNNNIFNQVRLHVKNESIYSYTDEDGRKYRMSGNKNETRYYADEGRKADDVWTWLDRKENNVIQVFHALPEYIEYPTQKPEKLLERIIKASSNKGDIILDAFAGSGTTNVVSEKLKRRWIVMDSGKLAIYTMQNRLFNLSTQIGSQKKDERREYERVDDFEEHSKSYSRGLFMLYEKARKGDLKITDDFLTTLSKLLSENMRKKDKQKFSLICPKEKFKVKKLKVLNPEKLDIKAGQKVIDVGKVRFLISFIEEKEEAKDSKPLLAKKFTLYNVGIYNNELILDLDWDQYKPFVAQLFDVRIDKHKIHSFTADGHIGTNSAYIWNYPEQEDLVIDREYAKELHKAMKGRAGEKFYIIAPIVSVGFMEDEIEVGDTTYVFLKVPLSILYALIEKGQEGALKQPKSEDDVNEVIDAVGYDFITHPRVKATYRELKNEYKIQISDFRSNTLVSDPDDFENFETFSMVMIDFDYNNDYFDLDKYYWVNDIIKEDKNKVVIRIPKDNFAGKKMMIIYMDEYGNELKVVKNKKDFS